MSRTSIISVRVTTAAAKSRRNRARALGALLMFLSVPPAWSGVQDKDLKPASMSVGFTKTLFLNVNRNDVASTFKALSKTVGRRRGYLIDPQTRVFDDATAIESALKDDSVMLFIVDSWQFLSLDIHKFVKPYFVTADQGKVGKKYVLLTRRGSGLDTLADLRGKDIVEMEATGANLGRPWLETLLLTNHLGTHAKFFGSVEIVGKPSTAVLPVFFGKKQGCVVDESGYEIMKELNPQVGQHLQVIATSDRYVNAVLCLTHSGWTSQDFRKDFIESLATLHDEPAGQQILTLFKVDQLVPFEEEQLDTVRKLRATYDRLRGESR
jgi:phosphonate transport system substrate-binding protein